MTTNANAEMTVHQPSQLIAGTILNERYLLTAKVRDLQTESIQCDSEQQCSQLVSWECD
jgi:hypothetical protein